ncbi:MAG: nuclear transport factor 2 family protein [Pseudonocardiales bacterium]|nr:nuclear transport factor 2 family protein [Pseudonocardiales bacterium]
MTTQNAELVRRGYDAFADGDLATVLTILDQNITWHVPGRSPLSGDYKGHDEVKGFLTTTMELSGGTFTIDINDILSDKERVVVLCTVAAERHGRRWSSPEVYVCRVIDNSIVDFREFQGDQEAEDEFWSS